MTFLRALHDRIGRLNHFVGTAVSWLAVVLIVLGTLNTILRYLGGWLHLALTSNAMGEIQWMLYAAMFLLGAGWVLKEDAHVRVDVLYERFSPRRRAWINLLGTLLLLLPFCAFGLWISWDYVIDSVRGLETTADAGRLPIWPAKTLILLGFFFLGLQGIALAIRSVLILGEPSGQPSDHSEEESEGSA